MAYALLARPPSPSKAIRPTRTWHARPLRPSKKAEASARVLLRQDAARFPLMPTLRTTLGVTGHRPRVGHLDGQDVLSVLGARNWVTGRLTTGRVERPRTPTRRSPQRYVPEAMARHVRAIARPSPAGHYPRGGVVIDQASWHRGALVTAGLEAFPPLELSPLPSSSPKLQVIARFGNVLRRRAPHNRLFPTLVQRKRTLRNSLCYYQTLQPRVLSVMQSSRKRTKSSAA